MKLPDLVNMSETSISKWRKDNVRIFSWCTFLENEWRFQASQICDKLITRAKKSLQLITWSYWTQQTYAHAAVECYTSYAHISLREKERNIFILFQPYQTTFFFFLGCYGTYLDHINLTLCYCIILCYLGSPICSVPRYNSSSKKRAYNLCNHVMLYGCSTFILLGKYFLFYYLIYFRRIVDKDPTAIEYG